ncbi:MAG: patatin-like phospholipase family protein, partial [Pseudomonadota bacterium]
MATTLKPKGKARSGPRRAITLAGGGPAAGLQIGALQALHEKGITFDVWAMSCIGAWVGLIYNTFDPKTAPEDTKAFFRDNIFREDRSYAGFPINHAFSPDIQQNSRAMMEFMMNPSSYANLYAPEAIQRTTSMWAKYMTTPSMWNEGDTDNLMLETMAANPMSRFMVSLMYLSKVNGLSRIYFKDSTFLNQIAFDNLYRDDRPFLYHNAFNLDTQSIDLFANRPEQAYKLQDQAKYSHRPPMKPVREANAASVCACSALPFVEETVEIDGTTYCEGALVETVNFDDILRIHGELDEIWVLRIVDPKQVRRPQNLKDGLANLCMLFAGSLGQDNVLMFEDRLQREKLGVKVFVVPVSHDITFDWNVSNLLKGCDQGYANAMACIENYLEHGLHHESFNDRVWRMDNHKDGDGYRAEAHAEASK